MLPVLRNITFWQMFVLLIDVWSFFSNFEGSRDREVNIAKFFLLFAPFFSNHVKKKKQKNQKCVSGYTVEVKLLCNFSKIPTICNIIPNKGALLNRLSSTRSYECDSFTDSHYTPFLLHLSLWRIQNRFEKWPQCIWTRIAFDGELQRRVMRISERIDFTPNKTKEVSLQKLGLWLSKILWYNSDNNDTYYSLETTL